MRTVLLLAFVALAGRPAAGQRPPPPPPALLAGMKAAAVPDSLLGRWEVVRVVGADQPPEQTGLVAFRFSAGGVLTVERTPETVRAAPDVPKRFRYRVEGRTLVFEDGGEPDRQAFRFEGDRLVIHDARQGITATLRRPER